jgi:energy-coupling factor transport system substrate-specific component
MGKSVKMLMWLLATALIIITSYFRLERYYLLISFVAIILMLLPQLSKFENEKLDSRSIVMAALIIAIASAARLPFAAIPSLQPVSAIVILTGYTFGADMGFLCGAMTAIVSNMILGQGPWTPWQMLGWGSMGYFAALFTKVNNAKIPLAIYGLVWGILYGWLMDMWFLVGFIRPLILETIFASFAASLYFDILHAITNFLLIYLFYNSFKRKFGRIKEKYEI